jgi:hypothetical protein
MGTLRQTHKSTTACSSLPRESYADIEGENFLSLGLNASNVKYIDVLNPAAGCESIGVCGVTPPHKHSASTLHGDKSSDSRFGRYTPVEKVTGSLWTGGWVDPRDCREQNLLSLLRFQSHFNEWPACSLSTMATELSPAPLDAGSLPPNEIIITIIYYNIYYIYYNNYILLLL